MECFKAVNNTRLIQLSIALIIGATVMVIFSNSEFYQLIIGQVIGVMGFTLQAVVSYDTIVKQRNSISRDKIIALWFIFTSSVTGAYNIIIDIDNKAYLVMTPWWALVYIGMTIGVITLIYSDENPIRQKIK